MNDIYLSLRYLDIGGEVERTKSKSLRSPFSSEFSRLYRKAEPPLSRYQIENFKCLKNSALSWEWKYLNDEVSQH